MKYTTYPIDPTLSYLAGFVDGEGCLTIKVRKTNPKNNWRWNYFHSPSFSITNNCYKILKQIKNILIYYNINSNIHLRKQGGNNLECTYKGAISLSKILYPYLVIKKQQAKVLILFGKTIKHKFVQNKKHQFLGKTPLSQEDILIRNKLTTKIRYLNSIYRINNPTRFKKPLKVCKK